MFRVVYPRCIRQHIGVCSFSLFQQVSEGETNWAQAQPDLLNSLPQAVQTAGSICIADGLSRTSCANPQTISVLIQPWRIKSIVTQGSWKSTRYVWSWCTKGKLYCEATKLLWALKYMQGERCVSKTSSREKSLAICLGWARRRLARSFYVIFVSFWRWHTSHRMPSKWKTTAEKTPICTVFLQDWVSQSYCWSVFWIFLR